MDRTQAGVPGAAGEAAVLARASVAAAAYQAVLFLGVGYVAAAFAGALLGAATNFTLNRTWAFPPSGRTLRSQLLMYAGASGLTYLALQAVLTLLVELGGVHERVAWVPAKGVAWMLVSYPLFRFVVFARPRAGA
jgi:putative flippase GtrA